MVLVNIIIFLIASCIVMFILSIVPVNIPKKFRMKIAIVSSMIVVLSLLLYSIYSIWVSIGTFCGLILFFSLLLGKQLSEEEKQYIENTSQLGIHKNDQNIEDLGKVDHVPTSGRMKQESIDLLLKNALSRQNEAVGLKEKKEITESMDHSSNEVKEIADLFERQILDSEDQGSSVDGQLAHPDNTQDLPPSYSNNEETKEQHPMLSIPSVDIDEEELPARRSVLEETEEETEEQHPTLGIHLTDTDEEGLLPRKSALDETEEETEEQHPALGIQLADTDEEGLPPRVSALEETEEEETQPMLGIQLADTDEEGLPPRKSALEELEEEEQPTKLGIQMEDIDEEEGLPPRPELEVVSDETEIEDDLSYFQTRGQPVEIGREKDIDQRDDHNEKSKGNAIGENDEFTDTILLKRSEIFEKLEKGLFDK